MREIEQLLKEQNCHKKFEKLLFQPGPGVRNDQEI
jgi:hypothetical protein